MKDETKRKSENYCATEFIIKAGALRMDAKRLNFFGFRSTPMIRLEGVTLLDPILRGLKFSGSQLSGNYEQVVNSPYDKDEKGRVHERTRHFAYKPGSVEIVLDERDDFDIENGLSSTQMMFFQNRQRLAPFSYPIVLRDVFCDMLKYMQSKGIELGIGRSYYFNETKKRGYWSLQGYWWHDIWEKFRD